MAIQKINLGTEPLGEGGDTYRSANTKINENFSNTTHAASKLVGTGAGQVPLSEDVVNAFFDSTAPLKTLLSEVPPAAKVVSGEVDISKILRGAYYLGSGITEKRKSVPTDYTETQNMVLYALPSVTPQSTLQLSYKFNEQTELYIRAIHNSSVRAWTKVYTDVNTKKDSKTNLLLSSGDSIPNTSAASKLVGTNKGQVPLVEDVATAMAKRSGTLFTDDIDSLTAGMHNIDARSGGTLPWGDRYAHITHLETISADYDLQISFPPANLYPKSPRYRIRHAGEWQPWNVFYNSGNTTVDSNNNIKTSSPVVRVFSDHLDKIHEANNLPIKYTRNGVGDYTIEGTTGLRDSDWQIVIPEDDHKNQLIAFTMEDDNGTIRLKTYKRTFSMETFTFGPDLSTPLDIPEGRWVDLHFNDLPQEELDEHELEPEEDPTVDEMVEPEVVEEEDTAEEESK